MTNLFVLIELLLVVSLLPCFGLMALVVIAAIWRRVSKQQVKISAAPSARFVFVIPAHDEEAVIGVTVRSCLTVNYDPERFQVFVIADNCTDETARTAEAAGAQVVVREDRSRKSKGFALEDFFRMTPTNALVRPFDAYVLVDADTSVSPDLLQVFDRSLRRGDDFVQGYYTVRNAEASWRTKMMTYAFSLANGVWLAGLDQLGLSVGLKGNGMCFRQAALDRFPWRAHGLVEDMEFAWNLRIGGERVRFEPLARVYGEMVSRGGSGAASQRRRWEGGRKELRSTFRERLWQSTHLSFWQKFVYQVDLDFPPLSRLVTALVLATIFGAVGAWAGLPKASWGALLLTIVSCWAILAAYVMSPIFVISLPIRYLTSLAYLPYYIIWKVCVGLLKKPQQWIRTPREVPSPTISRR